MASETKSLRPAFVRCAGDLAVRSHLVFGRTLAHSEGNISMGNGVMNDFFARHPSLNVWLCFTACFFIADTKLRLGNKRQS